MGPPPATGTLWWQREQTPPPAIAPLVPAPGRDAPGAPEQATARPQR